MWSHLLVPQTVRLAVVREHPRQHVLNPRSLELLKRWSRSIHVHAHNSLVVKVELCRQNRSIKRKDILSAAVSTCVNSAQDKQPPHVFSSGRRYEPRLTK